MARRIPYRKPVYSIGVVADLVGCTPRTLRVYEEHGLIRPQRTEGNTRLYSQADVELLSRIRNLIEERGVNLAGVRCILEIEREGKRFLLVDD